MGQIRHGIPVAGLAEKGRISAEDVLMLRGEVFRDGVVSRAEAESLFALHNACQDRCPEWTTFLVEAIGDYLVHQERPAGYISDDNADWLVRAISRDGTVDGTIELEVLISVLEKARFAPDRLSAFALRQVATAAIDGTGPLACGRELAPGIIGEAEVDLLRRILHAFSGERGSGISRAEAEVLFDLNDRTVEEMNHPSWDELFVKAIGNFVMCASGYEAPPREVALAREVFLDNANSDIAGFFRRMVAGVGAGLFDLYRRPEGVEASWRARNARQDADMAQAERVEEEEARWLVDRIGRDRLIHENERQLLAFIRDTSPDIHPALQPLLGKVA